MPSSSKFSPTAGEGSEDLGPVEARGGAVSPGVGAVGGRGIARGGAAMGGTEARAGGTGMAAGGGEENFAAGRLLADGKVAEAGGFGFERAGAGVCARN